MAYPPPASVARYNRAALDIALCSPRIDVEALVGAERARLSFDGFDHVGKVTLVLEAHRAAPTAHAEGYDVERLLSLPKPGAEPDSALTWRDTSALGRGPFGARALRHGRIDVADLFSTGGDATLSESMAIVEDAFALLRGRLAEPASPARKVAA